MSKILTMRNNILNFPSPETDPPVPSMRMRRPVTPIRTNAKSIHVLPSPTDYVPEGASPFGEAQPLSA
jgi:hypothetical protein